MVDFYTVKESGANLSRLLNHLDNRDVCFITAFRHEYSNKENRKRNKLLALDIHNLGLGYIRVIGGYLEEAEGNLVTEDTFAVIHTPTDTESQDIFFEDMLGLCNKYNQDAVLVALKDRSDIPTASYNGDGKIIYGPFSNLTTHNVEEFFTKIHGHKFKMESFTESEEGIKLTSFSNAAAFYNTKAKLKLYKK